MTAVTVRTGGQVAIGGGGAGFSSARPADVPTLVNGILTNPAIYFEDFKKCIIDIAANGPVDWLATPIGTGGGTPTYGLNGSGTVYNGAALCVTSATNNSGVVCEAVARQVGGTYVANVLGLLPTSSKALLQWRYSASSQTNLTFGFGLAATGCAIGMGGTAASENNIIADPDTFVGTNAVVCVTRHSAAYSGDTAGDLVLRVYGSTPTSVSLGAAPAVGSATYNKVELLFDYAAQTIQAWVNGTYTASLDVSGVSGAPTFSMTGRPYFGAAILTGGVSRTFNMDSIYHEYQLSAAR